MSIYLWLIEVLLAALWIYSLFAVIFPKEVVKFTIDKFNRQLKFYAFKADVRPTKRSASLIRWGHSVVLIVLTIYIALIYSFGEKFLLMLFNY